MAKKTRLKADAQDAPQSKEQVQALIKELGDNQREMSRVTTLMNDEIAVITERHTPILNELKTTIKAQLKAIQTWSEANRSELTDGKKSANMVTGVVGWRQRPPSVRISKASAVLEHLKKLGLDKFIRQKDEVNKDAMLADPELAKTIQGVSISTGVEDFYVEPFEQQVE